MQNGEEEGAAHSLVCRERAVFSHTRGAQVTLMVNSTGLVVREDNKTKKPVATYPIKKIQYQLVRHPACAE